MQKDLEDLQTINRGSITIVPLKPYYDWANSLSTKYPIKESNVREYNTYLVNDDFASDNLENVVKKRFKIIFEHELFGMWTNPEDWPQKRGFVTFKKWFRYYISSIVLDLEKGGVWKEEF